MLTQGKPPSSIFDYQTALSAIATLKKELNNTGEATRFFGQEREQGLQSILGYVSPMKFEQQFLLKICPLLLDQNTLLISGSGARDPHGLSDTIFY